MYNIFQGNDLIKGVIAKSLGYEENEENKKYSWFTQDIYFQTFFYLSKRFGPPSMFDEYKEAGAWGFKVKNYIIEIRLNSSWVEFMMYGKIGNTQINSPYIVKLHREWRKKREKLLSLFSKWNETEEQLASQLIVQFASDNQFDFEKISQKKFDDKFGTKWAKYVEQYNNNILNLNYQEIRSKYGDLYQNSYTRHALRTLDQFLKNMLTPIWVRDCAYNLKGKLTDIDASFYERYKSNITIEFPVTH